MAVYKYKIFSPGGNDTALVFGIEADIEKRRAIQDKIIDKHPHVEQVGFIDECTSKPHLVMTGGEFCGNATRTAAWHYLEGSPGEISIQVSGVKNPLNAGVTKDNQTWTYMPVSKDPEKVVKIDDGLYWVQLAGISHLVVSQRWSDAIIKKQLTPTVNPEMLKASAKDLVQNYKLAKDIDAYGVIFTENVLNMTMIRPCVFIGTAGTSYYETACGSGTVAVGLVASVLGECDSNLAILQPSGKVINATIEYRNSEIISAKISGVVSDISGILEG